MHAQLGQTWLRFFTFWQGYLTYFDGIIQKRLLLDYIFLARISHLFRWHYSKMFTIRLHCQFQKWNTKRSKLKFQNLNQKYRGFGQQSQL